MRMATRMLAALVLGAAMTADALADDRLIGSWVKHRTQKEDHACPGDTNWSLEVTFQPDGHFAWHSTRLEGTNTVDESVTGMYSVNRAVITILFDMPSEAARKRLPEWFAFWPSEMKGQQTFRFEEDGLVLVHDGGKLWLHMKRKPDGSAPRSLATGVGLAAEPDKSSLPPKAVITKVDVAAPHPEIVISDAAQFTKLLSLFPDLSQEKETDLAGGWEAKYQIVFQLPGRPEVKVTTSSDDTLWSSGKGDKALKKGLSAFLDPMFKTK